MFYVHLQDDVPVYLPGLNPTVFPAPKPRVITVVHFRATTQTRPRTLISRLRQGHYCDTALVAVTSHFPSKWWRACFGLCLQNRHRSRRVFQSIDREQEFLRLWRRRVECLDMLRSILQTFCPGFGVCHFGVDLWPEGGFHSFFPALRKRRFRLKTLLVLLFLSLSAVAYCERRNQGPFCFKS